MSLYSRNDCFSYDIGNMKTDDPKNKFCVCFSCLFTFGDVKVEKVAVQNSLHNSRNDSNEVVVILSPVAVDPVEQVESSVHAKGK